MSLIGCKSNITKLRNIRFIPLKLIIRFITNFPQF
jgi:hypothetical protein